MDHKGFANIVLIIAGTVVVGVLGYTLYNYLTTPAWDQDPIMPITTDQPPQNQVSPTTVFKFNQPFTVTGVPLLGTNTAPRYTSSEVLEESLVTIRAIGFWSNACERGGNTTDCPFKNEQMVRLETTVAESEGGSWRVKNIFLTDKSTKSMQYEGYQVEVISINSLNQQATIVIRKSTL